jgi:hypothetical protein
MREPDTAATKHDDDFSFKVEGFLNNERHREVMNPGRNN